MSYQAYKQLKDYWKQRYEAEQKERERDKGGGLLGDIGKAVGLAAFIASGGTAAPLSLGMISQGAAYAGTGEAIGKAVEGGDVGQAALGLGQLEVLEKQIKTQKQADKMEKGRESAAAIMEQLRTQMIKPEEAKTKLKANAWVKEQSLEKSINEMLKPVETPELALGERRGTAHAALLKGLTAASQANKNKEAVKNRLYDATSDEGKLFSLQSPSMQRIIIKDINANWGTGAFGQCIQFIQGQ
jgi:hypothetical protein